MRTLFFILLLMVLTPACTTISIPEAPNPESELASTPTPTPTPPKKPQFAWECRVSNGAGRIFTAVHETRDVAESRAHQRCLNGNRNCTLLECDSVEADEL